MNDHIAVIHDYPAVTGEALLLPLFSVIRANIFDGGVGERVNHTVTCAGADDEVISKGYDVFQVNQDDVFPFFIFKGIYDFACKF